MVELAIVPQKQSGGEHDSAAPPFGPSTRINWGIRNSFFSGSNAAARTERTDRRDDPCILTGKTLSHKAPSLLPTLGSGQWAGSEQ
jgi:hypothetical protein